MERHKRLPHAGEFALGAGMALLSTLALTATTSLLLGSVKSTGSWRDDFNTGSVNTKFWVVANGQAPGYIANQHIGYYDPTHVTVSGGYLTILLTQETGTVDANTSGVISRGGEIYSRKSYGYGTYQWNMRMSSTSSTPLGSGVPESGSVSAGFNYINNSQTEIDFEFPGVLQNVLYFVNWLNPDPTMDPTGSDETYTTLSPFDSTSGFHTYKFVWQPGSIDYYVDDLLKSVHTTNVPTAPAQFRINHWGTDSNNWGGLATLGVSRYFYVDWVSYDPL